MPKLCSVRSTTAMAKAIGEFLVCNPNNRGFFIFCFPDQSYQLGQRGVLSNLGGLYFYYS